MYNRQVMEGITGVIHQWISTFLQNYIKPNIANENYKVLQRGIVSIAVTIYSSTIMLLAMLHPSL